MRNKTLIIRWLKILLLALLYGVSLYPYVDLYPLIGISLFLGFSTYLGVGLSLDALKGKADARLLRAALAGQRGSDGKRRGVLGKIYPLDVPVLAPFSGRECAIASYDIYQEYWTTRRIQSGSTLSEPIIYSGYHMAPSEIRSSSEHVKILGFPELFHVPEEETTSFGRIESFIEQTDFIQSKGRYIKGVNDLSRTIQVDENGAAAEDFQFRQPVPGHNLKSREQVVETGSDVCLIGVFDAVGGAMVFDNRPFGRSMKLIIGAEEEVLSTLTKKSGMLIVLGLAVSMLCISLGLLPHAPDALLDRFPAGDELIQYRNSVLSQQSIMSHNGKREENQPVARKGEPEQKQPSTEVGTLNVTLLIQNGDVERLRRELSEGLDPDIRIPIKNGYSLPLIEAINFNQLEIARLLLESGADINLVNSYTINGLDAAISSRNTEAVRLLLGAGAEISSGDGHGLSPVNRAILNQDAEVLTLLLEAGADPSPPGCDQYIAALPADSEKADRIRDRLDNAREKRR